MYELEGLPHHLFAATASDVAVESRRIGKNDVQLYCEPHSHKEEVKLELVAS